MIRFSMLMSLVLLMGCSTFPDKIKLPDNTQLVSYEEASANAEQVTGKMIRWGGAIAKIENKPDFTVFEMVYYPLNGYGRPISDDESMGRFRIKVKGFMDPMVYKVGRLMTFTGVLGELEKGMVGEHKYVFPSAQAKGYYLWKNVQRIDVSGVHLWHQDYWYGYYPRPYHRRYFIRASGEVSNHSAPANRPSVTTYPKPIKTQRDEK
ncbi:Slp family lipoprotein [Paraglaciecola aestuariivivens]